MLSRSLLLTVFILLAACGDDDGDPSSSDAAASVDAPASPDAATPDAALPTTFGGARPALLLVPTTYSAATPMPLVVVLHGYSSNTSYAAGVLQLETSYEDEGFLVLMPVGTLDSTGNYFWNATDACCDQFGAGVDDVAYLNGVVDEVAAVYNVDAKRTYVVGHSNGGFMAYRMACESASRFAAIVSVAGATYDDALQCDPSEPVSVLQVHGTADTTIAYAGGTNASQGNAAYPSAAGSVQRWAGYDGCAMTTTAGPAINVTGDATAETASVGHDGCPAGIDVELWTVADGPHLIFFQPDPHLLWNWLGAHAKP